MRYSNKPEADFFSFAMCFVSIIATARLRRMAGKVIPWRKAARR